MSAFYLSAAHKSSGKTMVSMGLSAAIKARGLSLQTFKKGPDYIDPIWLELASGEACYNLDFYTSTNDYIHSQLSHYGAGKDVVLVEGNKGLHDGVALDGSDSNAALAKLLRLPVILVLDTVGITRGIAPLLSGYQAFDEDVEIAGVILNKVGGSRHCSKLINAIEHYTDIPVLGAIGRDAELALCERHLGLVPGNEIGDEAYQLIERWRDRVDREVDIARVLTCETSHPASTELAFQQTTTESNLRIAVARDAVFGFYYPGDLERFRALGVTLIDFDTTVDLKLPKNIDGLLIGGGFPETNLHKISRNESLLIDIKAKIESGLPTYAECGGLMYLCRNIQYKDQSRAMVGVIPADVAMHDKPQGRGYVKLKPTDIHPWCQHQAISSIQAHEFHYSSLINYDESFDFAYRVDRGQGIDGNNDGIIMYNLLASYCHLRQTDLCPWVDQFVNFVSLCKSKNQYDNNQQECRQSN